MINKLVNLTKIHSSPDTAFLMGFIYALIGILVAFFLFPSYIGIVSVFFTAMALVPPISRLMEELALREGREKKIHEGGITLTEFRLRAKKFSVKDLWTDHKNLIQVYFYSFFGVFLLFSAVIFILPQENGNYNGIIQIKIEKNGTEKFVSDEYVLNEQFEAYRRITGETGKATEQCFFGSCDQWEFFLEIIKNNLWVLIVTFLVSLIYGFGAMFIISWNASVWGMVFANRSLELAELAGKNPLVFFAMLMLTILPHTALEALTYFTAAISGGVASQGISKEDFESERFERILTHSIILMAVSLLLLVLAAFMETYVITIIDEMIPKY